MRIEKKVAYPAVVAFVQAVLNVVVVVFGLPLDESQVAALMTLTNTAGPLLMVFVGWLAPHTERPDLGREVV